LRRTLALYISVILLVPVTLLLIPGPCLGSDYIDRVRQPVSQSINIRQQTQKEREQWMTERAALKAQLAALQAVNRQLQDEQQSLQRKTDSAHRKTALLKQQIENSASLTREIRPFLETVYQRLSNLVTSDTPFLKDERVNRINTLRRVLDDPDLTISEKYRRSMETLFIEAEYGSTIEVYSQTINTGGQELTASIFRLGRVSLFFQSPDKNLTGYYNLREKAWKVFPDSYNRDIDIAFKIAGKRRPVKIVNLPLGRLAIP
jgi:uncharacterized protein DUF3450